MKRILITGSDGQLGLEFRKIFSNYPQYFFLFADRLELDVTDHKYTREYVENNNINIIINCAAYTDVLNAESNLGLSNRINNIAVGNLARIAKKNNIKLIHISTDYVFDGFSSVPYKEEEYTNPQTVYGQTKLSGEIEVQKINPSNSLIIRTSWLYSSNGNNFVNTMLSLAKKKKEIKVVYNQTGSPTYALDLAKTILKVLSKIKNKNVDLFHYSNEGSCSRYDFAKAIFEITKLDVKLTKVKSLEYDNQITRPKYSVLDKSKIKSHFEIDIPNWRDSLSIALKKNE